MAGMDLSNPYIKNDPDDFFSVSNSRPMGTFTQLPFGQYGGSLAGNMDPNSLNNYGTVPNGYSTSSNRSGAGVFDDEELMDSLASRDLTYDPPPLINGLGGDSANIDHFGFHSNIYGHSNNSAQPIESSSMFPSTPGADSVASPYVNNFNPAQYRIPTHNFGSSIHSPNSFTDSPLMTSDLHGNGSRDHSSFLRQGGKMGLSEINNGATRSPLTPKTPAISSLHIGSAENTSGFGTQPIRTASAHRHQKTLSGQWDQTSTSLNSFGGEFPSIRGGHHNAQISDILRGTSMPVKSNSSLQTAPSGLQSQEMKRRRRRESHNLVERRRRDNINERIQELSHLVPMHRLEDEKVRKALQNNSPLSPTLAGVSAPPLGLSPPQATSGLAGPGARRAAAGNITTGIPAEEKDKGPNKGDILNGAVSWTRDLMWMLHLKLQQQEELANYIVDLGGRFPFQSSEDEKRMQTELMDAILKNDGHKFHYSRAPGSGLRVPKHTDLKGDSINNSNKREKVESLSPENQSNGDLAQLNKGNSDIIWTGHNSGDSGTGSIGFKEDNEFCMDMTQ